MKKIAIIGASFGQRELCLKAKEMGIYTIAFAWEQGALCKPLVDKFYPISILEKDKIVEVCKEEKVDGVVTNASDLPAEIAAYVSEQLGLPGTPYRVIKNIRNKYYSRKATTGIDDLSIVDNYVVENSTPRFLPCVVKPQTGGGKEGISFVESINDFEEAIRYAREASQGPIMAEQYISGHEVSVEAISFRGCHQVVQITDKISSGAPHFIELAHHQPSALPDSIQERIKNIVPKILGKLEFVNGATHTEMTVTEEGKIYLIEVNPRGAGGYISNKLVELSTDFDYVMAMIEVALGTYTKREVNNTAYSGVYFLCKQTAHLLLFFNQEPSEEWLIEKEYDNSELVNSIGNSTRNGYLIYKSNKKIEL